MGFVSCRLSVLRLRRARLRAAWPLGTAHEMGAVNRQTSPAPPTTPPRAQNALVGVTSWWVSGIANPFCQWLDCVDRCS
jgi:hypothetical protein